MDITVTGRKMQVTAALKDYAVEKIQGACKVFDIPMNAEIVLHVERNPSNPKHCVAEVTLRTKRHVVRVEEADEDMYVAIDAAADKTQRQLRKFKTRVVDRRVHVNGSGHVAGGQADVSLPPVEFGDDEAIVRVKEIELQPLTEEEALIQTDLLGHDFFVYIDSTTGLTNVIYHRNGGGYGVIKPVIETEA